MNFEKAVSYLDRRVTKAIRRFELIGEGDRILVGLSGGKDSLALLHVLTRRRKWRKENYDVLACHVIVENQAPVLAAAGHQDLVTLLAQECEELGVPFLTVKSDPIPEPEELREKVSRCFLCSRRRKKALFEAAVAQGCNVVALAHHKQDAAETLLLNMLWQGRCEGLPPRRDFFGGLVRLIRPLILVDEADLAYLARLRGFPVTTCSCAYADKSRREVAHRILQLAQENGAEHAASNLLNVTLRLLTGHLMSGPDNDPTSEALKE